MSKTRFLLLGAGVGSIFTLAVLQLWGTHLQRTIAAAAQPQVLEPFNGRPAPKTHTMNSSIPWVPEISGNEHDSWKMRKLGGRSTSLEAFKGRVVLLNFWSTTCIPCIKEMPELQRLAGSLSGEEAVVLAVTSDSEDEVKKFLKRNPIGIPVYLATVDPPSDFAVNGYPTTVILDKSGTAVFRYVGSAKWADTSIQNYIRRLARPL